MTRPNTEHGSLILRKQISRPPITYENLTTIQIQSFTTGSLGDTNPTGTLTIPGSVDYGGITYTVTQIGEGAFSSYIGLTGDLTIPNSVKTIGDHAFSSCSGFTGNLTIGSSVKTIGDEAFRGCIGFTGSLTIGTSVETIGNNAFDSCIGLTGSLTIPNSVKTIGANASVSAQATITVIDDSIDVSTTPVDQSTADARDM